jgi:hypothetical protein
VKVFVDQDVSGAAKVAVDDSPGVNAVHHLGETVEILLIGSSFRLAERRRVDMLYRDCVAIDAPEKPWDAGKTCKKRKRSRFSSNEDGADEHLEEKIAVAEVLYDRLLAVQLDDTKVGTGAARCPQELNSVLFDIFAGHYYRS